MHGRSPPAGYSLGSPFCDGSGRRGTARRSLELRELAVTNFQAAVGAARAGRRAATETRDGGPARTTGRHRPPADSYAI